MAVVDGLGEARGDRPVGKPVEAPPLGRHVGEVGVHVDARHEPAAESVRPGDLVVVDLVGRLGRRVVRLHDVRHVIPPYLMGDSLPVVPVGDDASGGSPKTGKPPGDTAGGDAYLPRRDGAPDPPATEDRSSSMADETKTDSDADGLSDAVERQLGTNINVADSDGDGLIDGFEVAVGQPRVRDLSITDPAGSAAIVDDLVTGLEQIIGVTTHNVDSDGDGFADWVEEMRGGTDRNVADLTAAQVQNNQDPLEEFMSRAQSQTGVPYRFGAEADLNDSSGAAEFDSSELVQWAAHQAGVELPDGSWKQYQALHEAGSAVSVDVALGTKGALLFGFSSDPLASPDRPQRAYVAISLGNGKVLDVSERAGEVREMEPGNFFTHAATIPGFHPDGNTDTDGDGHPDLDEDLMGGDPTQGITTPWRDTWNMDSDGDGLSDAEDPEPNVPAAREPDPAAPVEPSEPSDSSAPPAPSEPSEPMEPMEPDTEVQYAAMDPAPVDFAEPYDPAAEASYGTDEPYGSEPSYDTAETYSAEMEG